MCSSSNAIYCSSNVLRCTNFSLFNMPANGVCLTFKQWLLRIEAVWCCLRGRRLCSATAQLNLFPGEWFGFLTFRQSPGFSGVLSLPGHRTTSARLSQAIREAAAALASLRQRGAHAARLPQATGASPPGGQLMGRPRGRPRREHGGRDPLQAAEQPPGAAEQDRGPPGRRHGRAAHPQGGRRDHR